MYTVCQEKYTFVDDPFTAQHHKKLPGHIYYTITHLICKEFYDFIKDFFIL